MRKHLLIGGTGRAGTSFLVQYLTGVGLDTHLSHKGGNAWWDESANAGLEDFPFGPGADALPYVIKQPYLYEMIDQMIESDQVGIDGVIVPMRGLVEAATSRTLNEMRSSYERIPAMSSFEKTWETIGHTPGGVVFSLNPIDQARLLAVGFHLLLERLVHADIPVVFLDFPRLVEDADYLFAKLRPFIPENVTLEHARATHAKLADPSKIRIEREVPAGERPPAVLARFSDLDDLDAAALKREVVRLRAEAAKNGDALVTLQDTHNELVRTTEAFHNQQKELDQQRTHVAELVKLLEQQRTHIEDLQELRIRSVEERRTHDRNSAAVAERYGELQRRHAAMATAFAAMTEQLEALCAERTTIEGYVGRLVAASADARRHAVEAQRSEHEMLAALADDSGSVASPEERLAFVTALRERAGALFASLESIDDRTESSSGSRRSWWR
jgi:hypothetical protein